MLFAGALVLTVVSFGYLYIRFDRWLTHLENKKWARRREHERKQLEDKWNRKEVA